MRLLFRIFLRQAFVPVLVYAQEGLHLSELIFGLLKLKINIDSLCLRFVSSCVTFFRWHKLTISSQVIGLPERVPYKTFHKQKLLKVLMLKPTCDLCEKKKEIVVLNFFISFTIVRGKSN